MTEKTGSPSPNRNQEAEQLQTDFFVSRTPEPVMRPSSTLNAIIG